jgi:hypothetical protein
MKELLSWGENTIFVFSKQCECADGPSEAKGCSGGPYYSRMPFLPEYDSDQGDSLRVLHFAGTAS